MPSARIPFAVAISDPLLLKRQWEQLSRAQRVVLKAFYGLPLDGEEDHRIWSAMQGAGVYDELGYLKDITHDVPYVPREYNELWALEGRRSGKTTEQGALINAYELLLGGHTQYVKEGMPCVALLVAQTKDIAIKNLTSIRLVIESSPLLRGEIASFTPEVIRLKNGIVIEAASPNLKNQRGIAVPLLTMDEVAFWYSDSESANPDYEVVRAITPAQVQFPHAKRFGISSAYIREGILYDAVSAGTLGLKTNSEKLRKRYARALVIEAPTALMGNPRVTREALEAERDMDPDAFSREFLSQFSDAVSGFLSRAAIEDCVEKGVREHAPMPRPGKPLDPTPTYVAAIDPAFRTDAFPSVVAHYEPAKGVVVDALRRFLPLRGARLNPDAVFLELLPLWNDYRVEQVHSDQYQFETLQQLALKYDIVLSGTDFTARSKAKILGNLQQLINRRQIRLPDPAASPEAAILIEELKHLERKISPNGSVTIAAPAGKHDDMAMCLALAAFHATRDGESGWLAPTGDLDLPEEHRVKTPFEKATAMLKARSGDQSWD
jgi:hypothetical protein